MKVVNKFTYLRIKLVRKGGTALIFNSDSKDYLPRRIQIHPKMRKKCNQRINYESTVVTDIITTRLSISSSQIRLILYMQFDMHLLDYTIILTNDHLIQKMPNDLVLLFKKLCLLFMQMLYVHKVSKKCQIILRCFCNNFVCCSCKRSIFWQKNAQSLFKTALFNEHYSYQRSISDKKNDESLFETALLHLTSRRSIF